MPAKTGFIMCAYDQENSSMREPRGLNRAMHCTRIHCGWPELAVSGYTCRKKFFCPLTGTGGFFFRVVVWEKLRSSQGERTIISCEKLGLVDGVCCLSYIAISQ